MRIIALLLFISFLPFNNWAQNNDFCEKYPLDFSGKLPDDFTETFIDKLEESEESNGNNTDDSKFDRKNAEHFHNLSTYGLHRFLMSGRVLFNDEASKYVNKVADKVLASDPGLRSQLRFYVSKSSVVNAFCYHQGVVIINVGLLAQLSTEAELAFIISHEVTHYVKNHGIDNFMENVKVKKNKGKYKFLSFEDKELQSAKYSKEHEKEADIFGVSEYYSKSGYNIEAIESAMDVLQYSYLPFDDLKFDTLFLNEPSLNIPGKYFTQETNEIKHNDNYDDTRSSHPNIRKRRKFMVEHLIENSYKGDKDFIVSEETFKKIRKIARKCSVSELMLLRNYPKAIYNAYLELKEDSNNAFYQKVIASSFYYIAKYYNNDIKFNAIEKNDVIEGESHQLYHLFNELNNKELSVLALKKTWAISQKYPNDKYLKSIADDAMHSLFESHEIGDHNFIKKTQKVDDQAKLDSLTQLLNNDSSKLSKYERIKIKRLIGKKEKESGYLENAFIPEFENDSVFASLYEELYDEYEEKDKEDEEEDVDYQAHKNEFISQEYEARKKHMLTSISDGDNLKDIPFIGEDGKPKDISSIIYVSPFLTIKDHRKKYDTIQYREIEEKRALISSIVEEMATVNNIEVRKVSTDNAENNSLGDFRRMSLMTDWMIERYSHDEVDVVLWQSNYIQKLIEENHSKYVAISGFVSVKEKKKLNIAYYGCGALVLGPFIAPYIIYDISQPTQSFNYFNAVFDLEKGGLYYHTKVDLHTKMSDPILKSYIYSFFFDLAR